MATTISTQDLENARRDIDDIGKAVNENTIVDPRYGEDFKSLPMISAEGQVQLDQLQESIDIAAAAGAGDNGWTDLLIQTQDGGVQRSLNSDIKRGTANRFSSYIASNGGYAVGDIVLLDSGNEVISEIANNTTNPNTSMTGWGIPSSSAIFPFKSKEVDVLLVYGQSNARGYAGNTPGAPTYKTPLARVWNGTSFAEITSYTPTANDGISTGSAWLAFANEYCSKLNRKLIVLNCARGSRSISDLQKGGEDYTALTSWVNGAMSALSLEGSVIANKFVAFSQGEADAVLGTSPTNYYNSLSQLWSDLKADFGFKLFGLYTVGYYADSRMIHGQVIQQAQRLFTRNNDDAILLYNHLGGFGSHNKLKVDGVHYNQRGYNIMGLEGAKRIASALYPENFAPATDEQINMFGSITMGQSQAWNMHSAVLRKASAATWQVNHTSPHASSLIKSVTEGASNLSVTLSCPARTILNFNANFGGALQEVGVRAVVGTGINPASGMVAVDVDGYSSIPVSFVADIILRIDMAAGTYNLSAMGTALNGVLSSISVTFPSAGQCNISHPTLRGLATGSISGSVGRNIRVNGGVSSTIVEVRGASDALSNDIVVISLPNMLIPPSAIPNTADLSFQVIAADYAIW